MRICVIPARGGSVRIPRKNIREFRGKPMMQWPIEVAQASGLFDEIIVSTDDREIAQLAASLACYVHNRPTDDGTLGTQDVVCGVLQRWPAAMWVCTIYPCSPLLNRKLLHETFNAHLGSDAPHLVSTYPGQAVDAGCLYWQWARSLLAGARLWHDQTLAYPLPANRCIDINTLDDWARAEQMFDALHAT